MVTNTSGPSIDNTAGVETVGTIRVDLSGAAKTGLSSKRVGAGMVASVLGTKHWNFSFELEVVFGAASSSLMFRTLIDGSMQGAAYIDFD